MGIGTKIVEVFGGTTSKSKWTTIAKQAGTKVVDQVKDAPTAAKVAGGIGVAGAGYVVVGIPTRDAMAFNGQILYCKPKEGDAFKLELLGCDRRYFYGMVTSEDGERHAVQVRRRKVTLFETSDLKVECNNSWKLKQVTSYWERRKTAKSLRVEAEKLDVGRIAA